MIVFPSFIFPIFLLYVLFLLFPYYVVLFFVFLKFVRFFSFPLLSFFFFVVFSDVFPTLSNSFEPFILHELATSVIDLFGCTLFSLFCSTTSLMPSTVLDIVTFDVLSM